jgi:hypothetical protein
MHVPDGSILPRSPPPEWLVRRRGRGTDEKEAIFLFAAE